MRKLAFFALLLIITLATQTALAQTRAPADSQALKVVTCQAQEERMRNDLLSLIHLTEAMGIKLSTFAFQIDQYYNLDFKPKGQDVEQYEDKIKKLQENEKLVKQVLEEAKTNHKNIKCTPSAKEDLLKFEEVMTKVIIALKENQQIMQEIAKEIIRKEGL